jgi:hypothetical protein
MSSPPDHDPCPGCGLELPKLDAPTPAHLGASSACWALYGRLLVCEYTMTGDGRIRQLTVATYAVQHPGASKHDPCGGTALQLIALYLLLERGTSAPRTAAMLERIRVRASAVRSLEPPTSNGTINVADVLAARTPNDHAQLVSRWARDVWLAWTPHHAQVRRWIERSASGTPPADRS